MSPDGGLTQFPSDELRDLTPAEDAILSGVFANAIAPNGDIRAYRAEPTLVVFEQGLRPVRSQKTAYQRVDVLSNARRVFSVKGGSVTPAPAEAVRIGVWETLAERTLLRPPAAPFGALEAIRAATAAGIPLKVLRPGDGSVLKGLTHSAATVASVQQDLDAGYVDILPQRPEDAGAATGWWRVNPATGETLGITTGGYGDSMVEYAWTLSWSYIWGSMGYSSCLKEGGSKACCLLEASAWGVMGAVTSWAFELSYITGDIVLGYASTYIPTVCGK